MKLQQLSILILVSMMMLLGGAIITAQNDLAAVLEVLEEGVKVQRFNTDEAIEIKVEAIVGVGDLIITDETGHARITFFEDGISTDLMPGTTYQIEEFSGDDETFTLSVTVLAGITEQQIGRALNAGSSYEVETPGMILSARGTVFDVRVEDTGRSAMIVSEGLVDTAADTASEDVIPGYGIRSDADKGLSEVVKATSFASLDSALDGCHASAYFEPFDTETIDDVRLNVRISPALDAPRVGTIDPKTSGVLLGIMTTDDLDWYRVAFKEGYGWFTSSRVKIASSCAGLRVYDSVTVEDPSLYENLDNDIDLSALSDMTPTDSDS